MEVVVVADTHLRAGIGRLPAALLDALGHCDAIVHAGDVVSSEALRDFQSLAPVHAVLGNNDTDLAGRLPVELHLALDEVPVTVVHDSGPAKGRAGRLVQRYPTAAVVVFGHSHVPVNEHGVDGRLLFNPGSPTQRRSQPRPTFGRLVLERGRVVSHTIEVLPLPAP